MYIETDIAQLEGGSIFEALPGTPGQDLAWPGDIVEISEEAIRAFREAAVEPVKSGTYVLRGMEQRISTVRAEISRIWNSALPDDEKNMQISARENEIALLQAGQFSYARAGFPLFV
ncbi:hypothetical protein [Desulfovibrio sp. Fe33]|uniref:hypothetical protein n=1 Tax=Desulfovibrio sp. Fe33 TaxID=3020842 RepID=UPI00234DFAF4|nr:hypothetical protein [Desulfovibrio sp. Fe33]